MKLFVIHRFKEKSIAKKKLKSLAKKLSLDFSPIFLDSSCNDEWKGKALNAINEAEAVIIFNLEACKQSANANWEIEKATEAKKEIIYIDKNELSQDAISKLKSIYDLKEEFEKCFFPADDKTIELYKLMIDSSESLIKRRQQTNAFFITAIGSLLTILGLLVKSGAITIDTIWLLYGFSIVGLLLCKSWGNLIENYGKLNKAKFDVILRLEKDLSAQIYSAEWVSLGKGLRRKKYQSFTATEKNVPLYFAILIGVLSLSANIWQIIS